MGLVNNAVKNLQFSTKHIGTIQVSRLENDPEHVALPKRQIAAALQQLQRIEQALGAVGEAAHIAAFRRSVQEEQELSHR